MSERRAQQGVCLQLIRGPPERLTYGPFDYQAERDSSARLLIKGGEKTLFSPQHVSEQHSGPKRKSHFKDVIADLYLKIWQRYIQSTSPVEQNKS